MQRVVKVHALTHAHQLSNQPVGTRAMILHPVTGRQSLGARCPFH